VAASERRLYSVDKISSLVIVLQTSSASESRGTKNKKGLGSRTVGEGKRREEGAVMRKRRNSFKYLESAIVFPPLPLPVLHFF